MLFFLTVKVLFFVLFFLTADTYQPVLLERFRKVYLTTHQCPPRRYRTFLYFRFKERDFLFFRFNFKDSEKC